MFRPVLTDFQDSLVASRSLVLKREVLHWNQWDLQAGLSHLIIIVNRLGRMKDQDNKGV